MTGKAGARIVWSNAINHTLMSMPTNTKASFSDHCDICGGADGCIGHTDKGTRNDVNIDVKIYGMMSFPPRSRAEARPFGLVRNRQGARSPFLSLSSTLNSLPFNNLLSRNCCSLSSSVNSVVGSGFFSSAPETLLCWPSDKTRLKLAATDGKPIGTFELASPAAVVEDALDEAAVASMFFLKRVDSRFRGQTKKQLACAQE